MHVTFCRRDFSINRGSIGKTQKHQQSEERSDDTVDIPRSHLLRQPHMTANGNQV